MSLRALACHWRPWGWRGGCADETGGAARIIKSYQGWLSTMPLLLTEADVHELLPMEKALERVEASFPGHARGVATKHMARAGASLVGLIGSGRQARTQLEAVAKVRALAGVKVFSRAEKRRHDFCREMGDRLRLKIEPGESAEAVARFGDIVITATSSREPVVRGEWLRPGTHVNAIGANMPDRREVDDATLARASLIAVDNLEQAQEEAGDLIQGLASLPGGWEGVAELHEIASGKRAGRTTDQEITLFKSSGIALWDIAVAGYVYPKGLAGGKGRQFQLLGE